VAAHLDKLSSSVDKLEGAHAVSLGATLSTQIRFVFLSHQAFWLKKDAET
jgi:hypothetical protein